MSDVEQGERKRQRRRQAHADRRAAETVEQRAVRLTATRARCTQDTEATERILQRQRQAYANRRTAETADQRSVRLAVERTRRARKRQQTTEATGQPEPEQQPEQGPAAGPSRVQEPRVFPRPASASVEARPPVVVEIQAGLEAERFSQLPDQRQRREIMERRVLVANTRARRQRRLRSALGYHDDYVHPPEGRHLLPPRRPCEHCGAQRWPAETGTICCNSGQVVLPAFEEPPTELTELFDRSAFMDNIRRYNSAFAFTSMGASVKAGDRVRQDETLLNRGRGPVPFRIQGSLCHRIGSLECPPDRTPAYAQLYYYDAQEEQQATFDARVNVRTSMFPQVELDSGIVAKIARILAEHHPLAASLQYAYERLHGRGQPGGAESNEQTASCHFFIRSRIPALDRRRYNRPTADEVAGIFIVPPGGSIPYGRDLVVQERHTLRLKQVFEQNQMFQAASWSQPADHHGERFRRHGS